MISRNSITKSIVISVIAITTVVIITFLVRWFSLPPLHQACYNGDIPRVRYLLSIGDDANAIVFDYAKHRFNVRRTPLLSAIMGGHADVIPILVSHGAKVNYASPGVHLPLCLALDQRKWECAVKLIEAGAEINAQCGHSNPIADGCRNIDVVRALFAAGLKATDKIYGDETVLDRVLSEAFTRDRVGEACRLLVEYNVDFSGMPAYSSRSHVGAYELFREILPYGDLKIIQYICRSIGSVGMVKSKRDELLATAHNLDLSIRSDVVSILQVTIIESVG